MKYVMLAWVAPIFFFLHSCTQNTATGAAKGAATGAVSGSLLGAVTDLIVDGEVDTYRLQRSMVSGALAGGTAGAVAGHNKDKREAAHPKKAKPSKEEKAETDKLAKKIGKTNVAALEDLVYKRHEDAFRKTMKSAKSSDANEANAAIAIQAMIDSDRGNEEGVDRALKQLVEQSDDLEDLEQARTELKKLNQAVLDERQIAGIN